MSPSSRRRRGHRRQGGVQLRLRGAGHPMRGPGVDEVGGVGEMCTGIDVPVLGGQDQVVAIAMSTCVGGDGLGDGVAAVHPEGAALTDGGLDIDDDQSAAGGCRTSTMPSRRAATPPRVTWRTCTDARLVGWLTPTRRVRHMATQFPMEAPRGA